MKWIRPLLLLSTTAALAAAAPSITAVQDAAGYAAVITRGAMAIVKGSGLGPNPLIKADSFPLQTDFNGASVQIQVNGTTTNGIMFYVWDSQSAFVLPSATPSGTGVLTYTYDGQSTTFPVTVVDKDPQIYTLDSSGSGAAVVTFHPNNFFGNGYVSNDNAINPGNIVILWMQGLGPVNNIDETNPVPNIIDLSADVQITVGGVTANTIYYLGRQPGLTSVDVAQFTWPSGVQNTCSVPIKITIGSRTSNMVTAPAADSGRTCTPASTGGGGAGGSGGNPIDTLFTQNELNNLVNGSTITGGYIGYSVSKTITLNGVGGQVLETDSSDESANGTFLNLTVNAGVDSATVRAGLDSIILHGEYGSCVTATITSSQPPIQINPNDFSFHTLDAGNLTASDGFGTLPFQKLSEQGFISYSLDFSAGQLSSSSSVTTTATGSSDVDPFTATIDMPGNFMVTNLDSLRTITRSSGIPVQWTPFNDGIVTITASTTSGGTVINGIPIPGSGGTTKTVSCVASASDGSFTIPANTANYLDSTQGYTGTLSIAYSHIIRAQSNLDFLIVTAENDTTQSAQFN